MSHLCALVGKHERPSGIEILPDLPRTMIGKPDRKALVTMEREKRGET
jgi:acyl-CoA synthetase (AMP-forming)/AMP-acid ligase II